MEMMKRTKRVNVAKGEGQTIWRWERKKIETEEDREKEEKFEAVFLQRMKKGIRLKENWWVVRQEGVEREEGYRRKDKSGWEEGRKKKGEEKEFSFRLRTKLEFVQSIFTN